MRYYGRHRAVGACGHLMDRTSLAPHPDSSLERTFSRWRTGIFVVKLSELHAGELEIHVGRGTVRPRVYFKMSRELASEYIGLQRGNGQDALVDRHLGRDLV